MSVQHSQLKKLAAKVKARVSRTRAAQRKGKAMIMALNNGPDSKPANGANRKGQKTAGKAKASTIPTQTPITPALDAGATDSLAPESRHDAVQTRVNAKATKEKKRKLGHDRHNVAIKAGDVVLTDDSANTMLVTDVKGDAVMGALISDNQTQEIPEPTNDLRGLVNELFPVQANQQASAPSSAIVDLMRLLAQLHYRFDEFVPQSSDEVPVDRIGTLLTEVRQEFFSMLGNELGHEAWKLVDGVTTEGTATAVRGKSD